jgi:hypothetical protein
MAAEPDIELPAPTAWPLIIAFGVTLTAAGLVTSGAVGMLGLLCAAVGIVGWFRDVLPHEAHVSVRVVEAAAPIVTARREVARLRLAPDLRRARLPLEIYPVSAGIKGGFAGSIAMAVLSAFHLRLFLTAVPIHVITSLLVGLLYGAMLPVMPRRPILLGGFIAPLFWSGLLYATLNIINPVLYHRIDWLWFVLSQIGFGLVAGLVVSWQERIRTWQAVPLAVRIGVETPGFFTADEGKERP